MIKIEVFKVDISRMQCDNVNCKRLPEYFDQILNSFFLKRGTICASITIETNIGEYGRQYYCRDCIDEIYQKIKSKLDSKLWIFQ